MAEYDLMGLNKDIPVVTKRLQGIPTDDTGVIDGNLRVDGQISMGGNLLGPLSTIANPDAQSIIDLRADLASGEAGKGGFLVRFIQAGVGAIVRWFTDKIRENVSVEDFGAIGDGASHPLSEFFDTLEEAQEVYPFASSLSNEIDWAASVAAMNSLGLLGGTVNFGPGRFLMSPSLDLVDDVVLKGSGWESTEIAATGDHPVLQYVGVMANQLRRAIVRDMLIRGNGKSNLNSHGIRVVWANKPQINNVQFRSCRRCISAGYTVDIILDQVYAEGAGTDANYMGLWLEEVDNVTYPTADNTQIMSNVGFRQMEFCGVRVEGSTGLKATNVICLNGDYGWYFGDAPLGADARLIRFLHLTNCFSDTNNLAGWKFSKGAMAKIRDVKMVNCWSGSVSAAFEGKCIDIDGMELSVISAGVFTRARANTIKIANSNDIQVSSPVLYDHDWSNGGADNVLVQSSERINFTGISGRPFTPGGGTAGIRFEDCSGCSVAGGAMDDVVGVELHNTVKTSVTGITVSGVNPGVVETGTSNFNTVVGNTFDVAPVLIGANTVESANGGNTNPRTSLIGGSASSPALFWRASSNSGLYRFGTSGMGYSFGGTAVFGIADDSGNARPFAVLPTFADNAAAVAGGLAANRLYKTATGEVRIRV